MKSFRGTFIFTLIVVVACVVSYFEVFKRGNEEAEQKEKDSLIYKLMADEIIEIDLTNQSNLISLKKIGDTWSLEQPVKDKADQAAVKSFIDMIVGQKTSDLVEEGDQINWKTYGLDQPPIRLKLTGIKKDAKQNTTPLSEEVSFGSVKAYDGSNYSRIGDQKKLYVTPSFLSAALNKKPSDFRNKNLFTTSVANLDHIKIDGTQKLEIERTKESWRLLSPVDSATLVTSGSVQVFLDQVKNLKGLEIISDNKDQLNKYHLDKAFVTLSLHRAEDPKDFELKISDPAKDKDHAIYMTSTDVVGVMKGAQSHIDTVNKVAFDFTDKHQAFAFGTADVGSIEISAEDFHANLKKNANIWLSADAPKDKREVDTAKVEEFLDRFNHLEAVKLAKSKASSLKNQIVIKDSNAQTLFKMNWGEAFDPSAQEAKTKAAGKKQAQFVQVSTNKFKDQVLLSVNDLLGLGMKSIFKNPDPIQFSSPPPPKISSPSQVKKSSGASLDKMTTPEKQK